MTQAAPQSSTRRAALTAGLFAVASAALPTAPVLAADPERAVFEAWWAERARILALAEAAADEAQWDPLFDQAYAIENRMLRTPARGAGAIRLKTKVLLARVRDTDPELAAPMKQVLDFLERGG
jgi:hypothetical protein